MDGCRLNGYTISSPCEPNGSGELKNPLDFVMNMKVAYFFWFIFGFGHYYQNRGFMMPYKRI